MGTRMIRDRSNDGRWWLLVALFTLCVLGWTLAFSLKAGASDSSANYARDADRTWQVADFDQIVISGSTDIELVQGESEGVYGQGDTDDLDELEIYVEGRKLIIRPKKRSWISSWGSNDVNLVIELRDISGLRLSGSGELDAQSLEGGELTLSISGSGDIDIEELRVGRLELTVSGSADVDLAGEAQSQEVVISGSGDYSAEDLASVSARVRVSGSADARIRVRDSLEATVSGSGSVRYRGKPDVSRRVSGSGDIRSL